jgi:Zn-finger nucleic acid-binding protein
MNREDLTEICTREEQRALALAFVPPAIGGVVGDGRVRYRKCPECSSLMGRKNFAAGSRIVMDVCARHGVWLDGGELRAMLEFIRTGGMSLARSLEMAELERGRAALERARSGIESDGEVHWTPTGPLRGGMAYDSGRLAGDLLRLVAELFR